MGCEHKNILLVSKLLATSLAGGVIVAELRRLLWPIVSSIRLTSARKAAFVVLAPRVEGVCIHGSFHVLLSLLRESIELHWGFVIRLADPTEDAMGGRRDFQHRLQVLL